MQELVFIEANHATLRAINIAHSLGLNVRFITSNPDFYSPTSNLPLPEVDALVVADTSNGEALLPHVERTRTCGVIAFGDHHLLPAAQLAAKLGLLHHDLEALGRARFKDRTRRFLQEKGERRPRFFLCSGGSSMSDSPIGYPCVVKPVDDSGSLGVTVCRSQEEFVKASALFAHPRTNPRGYRLSGSWLVEEFIAGPEFSAECLWTGEGWHLLGITKKLVTPPPYCVEMGHVFPADLLPYLSFESISTKVLGWLDMIGLNWGAAHVEFKISDGEPVLIEINPRLAGDRIPELLHCALNFDPVEFLVRAAAGMGQWDTLSQITPQCASAIRFLIPEQTGVVESIQGIDAVQRLPFVVRYKFPNQACQINGVSSSYDRLGYVITQGKDSAEAEANARLALEQLRLCYQLQE